ncbi:hypothetical protein OG625_19690 [Streptomyces sp. NBC_01351]|uniref:hypothetical protein n=1 Tax=Streptomyces sp. NBC_01351 TaxID=2903833 RepID=UPI002E33BFEF|nr:hypothetical protein [Streptomyces sp. NBC_01351]
MIQGFRPTRWLACAALAAAALAPTAPALAFTLAPAWHLGPAAPRASAPAPDDTPQELAGSAAGVGRDRPGRPVGEPANPELVAAPRPLPVRPRTEPQEPPRTEPTPPAAISALGTEPNERAADLAAHIMPLGTGFALMGLGLGYLGMRLRRSA